jgi:hypothetical protein
MNIHRFLRIWTFLTLAACTALFIHTVRQRARLDEARETARAHQSAFHREHAALAVQLASLDSELTRLTAELAPPATPKPKLLSLTELSDRDTRKLDTRRQRDPAQEEWHRNLNRRLVHMNNGELIDRLPLTPDQRTRFKQLLFEKQMSAMDAHTVAIVQGQPSDSPTTREAVKQTKADFDREIHALLGDENFAEYQEHERTIGDRARVGEFNAALSEKNLPLLTPAQVRALASAANLVEDPARNPDHALTSKDSLGPVATAQILQRIPGILTPAQLDAFTAYRAEKKAARTASQNSSAASKPLPACRSPPLPLGAPAAGRLR